MKLKTGIVSLMLVVAMGACQSRNYNNSGSTTQGIEQEKLVPQGKEALGSNYELTVRMDQPGYPKELRMNVSLQAYYDPILGFYGTFGVYKASDILDVENFPEFAKSFHPEKRMIPLKIKETTSATQKAKNVVSTPVQTFLVTSLADAGRTLSFTLTVEGARGRKSVKMSSATYSGFSAAIKKVERYGVQDGDFQSLGAKQGGHEYEFSANFPEYAQAHQAQVSQMIQQRSLIKDMSHLNDAIVQVSEATARLSTSEREMELRRLDQMLTEDFWKKKSIAEQDKALKKFAEDVKARLKAK